MFRLVLTVLSFQAAFGFFGGGSRVGGYSDVTDTQSPRFKIALATASKNVIANDQNLVLKYKSMVSAKQQVVNGINYKFVLQFSVVASKKGLLGFPRSVEYEVVVNQPPSRNSLPTVVSANMVSALARGAVAPDLHGRTFVACAPGAPCETAVTPEIRKAASVVTEMAKNKIGAKQATNVEIISARQQVVAGMNYFLKMKMTLDGRRTNVDATVYRGFDGKYTVVNYAFSQVLVADNETGARGMSGGEIGLITGASVVGVVLVGLCLAWTRIKWSRKGFSTIQEDAQEQV